METTNWKSLHGEHFKGSRVLVTGGAGFIGSHLTAALVSLGASVVVIDDLSGGSRENLASAPSAQFVEASILERGKLAECVRGCQYVFHLAALGSVPRSVAEPRLYCDVNITGTLNVLEESRAAGARRVMFAASSSAYGENPVPWRESMPVMAKSPYAATKASGEALLSAYAGSYGLDTVSLRYFNIFGPRQNANSAYAAVIAAFAKAVLTNQPPVIYGDGEQSRDFTFVDNAVHANLLAAAEKLDGQVVNVGCGGSITVNELAAHVLRRYERNHLPPVYAAERAGDLKHSYADLERAGRLLKYRPIVGFADGLAVTLDWYKSAMGG